MKKFLFFIFALIAFVSCVDIPVDSNREIAAQQEALMQESHKEIGMPAVINFQEKKLAKMIIEQRDREDLICYAYIVNHMTGKLVFLGKCIGYGLPYCTQYTNPVKTVDRYYNSGIIEQLPQADPNGLFMPDGLSATWLMMLDPKTNEPRPVYLEPEIIVSPFPLS